MSTYRAWTRGDRRDDCQNDRGGDDRRDSGRNDRPVYTLQAIVAARITCLIQQPTGDCRGDDRLWCIHGAIVATTVAAIVAGTIASTIAPTGCVDDRPVYTPYAGWQIVQCTEYRISIAEVVLFLKLKRSDSKSAGRKRILTWNIDSRSFILQSVTSRQLVAYRYIYYRVPYLWSFRRRSRQNRRK